MLKATLDQLIGDTSNNNLRGLTVGLPKEKIMESEGNDGDDRGKHGGIVYNRDISDDEPLGITYTTENDVIDSVQVNYTCDLNPIFEQLKTDENESISSFIYAKNKLKDLQQPVAEFKDKAVAHFTKLKGEPEISYDRTGLVKVTSYSWEIEQAEYLEFWSISYYFEYNNEYSIYRQNIEILLTRYDLD